MPQGQSFNDLGRLGVNPRSHHHPRRYLALALARHLPAPLSQTLQKPKDRHGQQTEQCCAAERYGVNLRGWRVVGHQGSTT